MNATNDSDKSSRLSELSALLQKAACDVKTLVSAPASDHELDQAWEEAWVAAWRAYLRERADR